MGLPYVLTGNDIVADSIQVGSGAGAASVIAGNGVPTLSSTKGTLYLNTAGSSSSTRLYVNNGTTNWIAVTTAS